MVSVTEMSEGKKGLYVTSSIGECDRDFWGKKGVYYYVTSCIGECDRDFWGKKGVYYYVTSSIGECDRDI